jgi:hypothetical protein
MVAQSMAEIFCDNPYCLWSSQGKCTADIVDQELRTEEECEVLEYEVLICNTFQEIQ